MTRKNNSENTWLPSWHHGKQDKTDRDHVPMSLLVILVEGREKPDKWLHCKVWRKRSLSMRAFLKKKRFYLFIFRERGRRKGEKHQCEVASPALPTGDLAHPLVCRPTLNQLSYTSQGPMRAFKNFSKQLKFTGFLSNSGHTRSRTSTNLAQKEPFIF